MTLLLDTHAFLWFWWADPQMSAKAMGMICDPKGLRYLPRIYYRNL
jgi:PIN domain nuclease of toxin-antitoxin system